MPHRGRHRLQRLGPSQGHLFARTNGALLEWLNSPIRYRERGDAAESLRQLAPQRFNPTALCYHYSHLAKHNAREYLFEGQVRLKTAPARTRAGR